MGAASDLRRSAVIPKIQTGRSFFFNLWIAADISFTVGGVESIEGSGFQAVSYIVVALCCLRLVARRPVLPGPCCQIGGLCGAHEWCAPKVSSLIHWRFFLRPSRAQHSVLRFPLSSSAFIPEILY